MLPSTVQHSLKLYAGLMRLDRPVGTLLLLWPTLAALWIAAQGTPSMKLILVFTLGTFLMRAAGCVINDYADRHIDGHVERTADRVLTSGKVSEAETLALFALLATLAFFLVLLLNSLTLWLALAGMLIAISYPFMKRWTYLPQVVLGAAFSWGIPMTFAATRETVPNVGWLMFLASLLWIVAYDTLYAMVDREDDLKIGVKSTAILFGDADRLMVGALQASAFVGFSLLGGDLDFGIPYFVAMLVIAGLFAYQQYLIRDRGRAACFQAFTNNVWVGFVLFVAVVIEETLLPILLSGGS